MLNILIKYINKQLLFDFTDRVAKVEDLYSATLNSCTCHGLEHIPGALLFPNSQSNKSNSSSSKQATVDSCDCFQHSMLIL